MNWGVKIFLTLLIFIIAAVSTGIYMVSKDQDTLVEDDYYEKGLTYDSQYDHKSNVQRLKADPEIAIEQNSLLISFTKPQNKGRIDFQRTADSSQDTHFDFEISGSVYRLPLEGLSGGKWKILINWESDGTLFLVEKNITVP